MIPQTTEIVERARRLGSMILELLDHGQEIGRELHPEEMERRVRLVDRIAADCVVLRHLYNRQLTLWKDERKAAELRHRANVLGVIPGEGSL